MAETNFSWKIEGMTCGNCALTISKYLEKQGMTHVSANAASGEVNFTTTQSDPSEKLIKGIHGLGYRVVQEDEDGHHVHEGHQHAKNSKLSLLLVLSAIFTAPLLLHMFLPHDHILQNPYLQLILCFPVYAIGVYRFGVSAWRSLKNGIANMDVLIIIGASAAFVYSIIGMVFYADQAHEYLFFETTATIITFVLLGNWIEEKTVTATTSAIRDLARLQPAKAKVVMTDSIGKESIMEMESRFLKVNDVVLVNDGDRIPADGIVVHGLGEVNESMLTGESLPVEKLVGSQVTGGSLMASGNLRIRATAVGSATALAEIIKLVRQAQGAKPPMQQLADKISAVFVPVVLGIAALTFLINFFVANIQLDQSIMRSVAVLVIACPCAMGLATPAAVAVGMGRAARQGILIKGGDTLEKFKDIRQIVFDKTGTLTNGQLMVKQWRALGISDELFRAVVVALEKFSVHPISTSILQQWAQVVPYDMESVKETKGIGLRGTDKEGNQWQLGSFKILKEPQDELATYDLHLLRNNEWVGGIQLADELRTDAAQAIRTLQEQGYKTILLSGDRRDKAEEIAQQLGITEVLAEQSPAQKMEHLETLLRQAPTVMVGDGINDAPALAKADIGVSLSDASQVAMQSANVVLSGQQLSHLPKAIRLGKFTYQTIKQNLFWAFFYNVLAIPLAAMGYLSPIWAAVIMAFSDVILVLNSLRLNFRKI